jgi:uncharacterized protein (TIGR02600 family)
MEPRPSQLKQDEPTRDGMRAGHIKIMRGIAESSSGVQCHLTGTHTSLKRQSGAALVIVLSFLVLITIMVVAFFSSTATEAVAAKTETHLQTTRQLADSTIQYVIGQIRQATSGGTTRAWASQPGMIRTWDTSGNPEQAFKLYSANKMRDTISGNYSPSSDMPGSTWASDKALWTDLNAPILSGNNTIFPILDPRAAATLTGNHSLVEGFSYVASALSGAQAPTSTSDATARVPMPVRWIYVLKDGRFSTPSSGSGTLADFANSDPKPTASNPIVGRVAFWTDDETCKLNLNTAVGGVPWDIPTYTAGIDLHFSRYKPVKDEFTRYPGHPATTSLAPVLWSFGNLKSPDETLMPFLNPTLATGNKYHLAGPDSQAGVDSADAKPYYPSSGNAAAFLKKTLDLNPKNKLGGSELGTKPTVIDESGSPEQMLDSDRLLSSVDEVFFGMPSTSNTTRSNNAFSLQSSDVDKLRFFLTTHSRAPETSPLNQPKVGIWPINEAKKNPANPKSVSDPRTPTDKLMAFCSTLNGQAYYFTRNNPDSSTADFAIGSRNDKVFDYLENSLSKPIPGFGGNLNDRYTTQGLRRLLTLSYDFTRVSNMTDTYDFAYRSRYDTEAPFAFVPPRQAFTERGRGQVVPIKITKAGQDYKGLGRFVTIKQVGLHFIAQAANQPPCLIDTSTGKPTASPNPMHPWTADMPAAVAFSDNGDGTWSIDAGSNAYPTLPSVSGNTTTYQTHAGLPFRSDRWIQDQNILTSTDNATITLRNTLINRRYQGPSNIYGSGTSGGNSTTGNPTNSQLLPRPWPNAEAGSLGPHQTLIQAIFLLDPVLVNPGNPPYIGAYKVRVKGLDGLKVQTISGMTSLGFGGDLTQLANETVDASPDYNIGYGTISGFRSGSELPLNRRLTLINFTDNSTIKPIVTGSDFAFEGGTIEVEILTAPATGSAEVIQKFTIEFPSSSFPTPLLAPMPTYKPMFAGNYSVSANYTTTGKPSLINDLTPSSMLTLDESSRLAKNTNFGVGSELYSVANRSSVFIKDAFLPERMTNPEVDFRAKLSADTIRTVEVLYGDTRVTGLLKEVPSSFFKPHKYYHDKEMRSAHSLRKPLGPNYQGTTDQNLSTSTNATYTATHAPGHRDNYRGVPALAAPKFQALGTRLSSSLLSSSSAANATAIRSGFPNVTSSVDFANSTFTQIWNNGGDFDTGPGLTLNGPYIGKSTEGGQSSRFYIKEHLTSKIDGSNVNPDFNNNVTSIDYGYANLQGGPNKQIPSSVVFGSLPVGNTAGTSWRTLLFSPNPVSTGHLSLTEVATGGNSPISGKAPDFLYMDFFNMPIVEPYAISEPFSTAGKVNLNYQIAPFTYIQRDTALRGVLRSVLIAASEDRWAANLKYRETGGTNFTNTETLSFVNYLKESGHWAFRYPIHVGETLKQFTKRFSSGDIFRSPSEICSLWLYPGKQPTAAAPDNSAIALVNWNDNATNIKNWWYENPGGSCKSLTGDNMRERPYAALYPRLTTKSNTYTLHCRVQTLSKRPGSDPTNWDESKDRMVSEYRGSAMIERYIDPSDPKIPDFTSAANANVALDEFYRYRVLNTKRFAP